MDQWCVYILKGDKFYVGSTNNLPRRLKEHKRGNTHTTKRIGEWKLYNTINCKSKDEARKLELKIKKGGHPERRTY